MTTEKLRNTTIKIPRIIHFIWAGGAKLLPIRTNTPNVIAWAERNPAVETWLWVDSSTYVGKDIAEKKANLIADYQKRFPKNDISWGKSLHNSQRKFAKCAPIILKDIEDEKVCDKHIRYHINKLRPNYGISSDLLRYVILAKYGGAYFDSDVGPGNNSLEEYQIFSANKLKVHVLYIDYLSQQPSPALRKLSRFVLSNEFNAYGNDALISTPGNPLVKKFYAESITSLLKAKIDDEQLIQMAYGNSYFVNYTIDTTGPAKIKEIIQRCSSLQKTNKSTNNHEHTLTIDDSTVVIKALRYKNEQTNINLVQPANANTRHWINVPDMHMDLKDIIPIVSESIEYELANLGVLRLEDYLLIISKCASVSIEKAKITLLDILKLDSIKKNMRQLRMVQYTFSSQAAKIFTKLKLPPKTGHTNPDNFKVIINWATHTEIIFNLFLDLRQFSKNIRHFKSIYPRHRIDWHFEKIMTGIQFIEAVIKPVANHQFLDHYQRGLSLYIRVLELLKSMKKEKWFPNEITLPHLKKLSFDCETSYSILTSFLLDMKSDKPTFTNVDKLHCLIRIFKALLIMNNNIDRVDLGKLQNYLKATDLYQNIISLLSQDPNQKALTADELRKNSELIKYCSKKIEAQIQELNLPEKQSVANQSESPRQR